ncbi:MAG: ATP-binding protein [Fibromonadaceae bacterium]|jgi:hypothetical protein|nr:ATP-binding protein [Fibromonadaceae bacterium]
MMPKKKPRIDLSSSEFAHYIEKKLLYVDKSMFIEHFMDNPSKVLLITRPRRMGKSLNMNMLAEFLDCQKNSGHLFKGLKIEKRKMFKEHLNKYPVVYLTFKNLHIDDYKLSIKQMFIDAADKYIPKEKRTAFVKDFITNKKNVQVMGIRYILQNISEVYGKNPVVLIDEYDKILMDNIKSKEYENLRNYISGVFNSGFKDNPYLHKALLTGVLRISQESIFSNLNNVEVFDVFAKSEFDEDFGLTEKEVKALVEPKDFKIVKRWYDGIRVGNSYVFYIYSVMYFLSKGEISNYWGQSGTINLLGDLLTQSKALCLGEAVKKFGNTFTTELDPRVSLKELFSDKEDKYYYALAVQAGYLAWSEAAGSKPGKRLYKLCVPNEELMMVWEEYILSSIVKKAEQSRLAEAFEEIEDTEYFGKELTELLSYKLSYFDLHDNLEKTYHGFVLGLMVALGFDVRSNNSAGAGRYDLFIETKKWTAVVEFKVSKTARGIKEAIKDALAQIERKKYLASASKKKPAYAIGVGVHKNDAEVLCERAW